MSFQHDKLECFSLKSAISFKNTLAYFVRASVTEKLFNVIENKWEVYKTFLDLSLLFWLNKLECLVVKPPPSLTNTISYFVIASVTEKKNGFM